MNNKNMDMAGLMSMLAKMDKKELEKGLNQVSKMLNNNDADKIINEIKRITRTGKLLFP